jgi:hypothetical protein
MLAHAFLWKYTYKRLKLAQLLGKRGLFLAYRRDLARAAQFQVDTIMWRLRPILPDLRSCDPLVVLSLCDG